MENHCRRPIAHGWVAHFVLAKTHAPMGLPRVPVVPGRHASRSASAHSQRNQPDASVRLFESYAHEGTGRPAFRGCDR